MTRAEVIQHSWGWQAPGTALRARARSRTPTSQTRRPAKKLGAAPRASSRKSDKHGFGVRRVFAGMVTRIAGAADADPKRPHSHHVVLRSGLRRIFLSCVTSTRPSARAVAPMSRSAGSRG